MKRTQCTGEEKEEFQLLEQCMGHPDIWSQIVKRLTVVDELLLSSAVEKPMPKNALRIHYLKASRECGSTYYFHRCAGGSGSCSEKEVFKLKTGKHDTRPFYILESGEVDDMEIWSIKNEEKLLTVNVFLQAPLVPNFGRGDSGYVQYFQLIFPISGNQSQGSTISYLCTYQPEFLQSNGLKRAHLSREAKLSEYEIQNMTSDLECVVYS